MSLTPKCTCGHSISGVCISSIKECKNIQPTELPASVQERIKADAELFTKDEGYQKAYFAGAMAEAESIQPVVLAAEKVAKLFAHKGEHQTCAICQLARALQQWKEGKEEPVCTCSVQHLAAHGECYKCPGKHTKLKH